MGDVMGKEKTLYQTTSFVIFTAALFLFSMPWGMAFPAQAASGSAAQNEQCLVRLRVVAKETNVVLGQLYVGKDPLGNFNMTMELEEAMPTAAVCNNFRHARKFVLNGLSPSSPLNVLKKNYLVTASLHNYAPDPRGKKLSSEYQYAAMFDDYAISAGSESRPFQPPVHTRIGLMP